MPSARFIQYGLGPIGTGIADLAAHQGHRLVAVVDIDPAKIGRPAAAFISGAPADVVITADAATVLNAGADIVLHSTQSRLAQVFPQLLPLVDAGLAVISTCEELAFPWIHHPVEAASLDALARSRGVGVVGLGVNPGFVMDLLPVILTSPCRDIRRITVSRVVDVDLRRVPLQQKVGVGLPVEEFRRGVAAGHLGHIGLPQSAAMIAHALGWTLNRIDETIEPVVGRNDVVQGVHQVCRGTHGTTGEIILDLTMAAGAQNPRDEIAVEATPPIRAIIAGGIHGDQATYAIVVNAVPRVLAARPGLLLPTQLPPVAGTTRT
ncbi:MAG: dihydrodipicolinate reductase [Bacillati bacterium ANGP1]|uniref:Dihydrodipicolinate reductase n=1 Tax=Candidatus Segetimicrobium genomatis TaxID=2569760 RepID=A0A537IX29_9BACT|nr:MAG: dihydrodipicolinate reductase [Terrabacteria group bacterium ANGP1]